MTTSAESGVGDDQLAAVRARLHAFIARRVENATVAEDLTQEVLVRLLSRRDSHLEDPAAWLYRVARNVVIDHYRSRRPEWPLDSTDQAGSGSVGDPFADDAVVVRRELAQCLRSLVQQLPEPYRSAVVAVDLGGTSQVELARASGISVSGAKSRVQRGRRQLHRLVAGCCPVQTSPAGSVIDYQPSDRCEEDPQHGPRCGVDPSRRG